MANVRALFERALPAAAGADGAWRLWDAYLRFEVEVGSAEAARGVEARRRAALGALPHDALALALMRHAYLDLWPCTRQQRPHLQRLLGLAGGGAPAAAPALAAGAGAPAGRRRRAAAATRAAESGPAAAPAAAAARAAAPAGWPPPPSRCASPASWAPSSTRSPPCRRVRRIS